MGYSDYDKVCYLTEQREETVTLRNTRTGDVGYSFGCTYEGGTIQVRLSDGSLDSWERDECMVVSPDDKGLTSYH